MMALLCFFSVQIALLNLFSAPATANSFFSPSEAPSPLFPVLQEPSHQMQASLLGPILTNLGFEELAMAVPALYSPVLSSWSGPLTLFAPSDDSIRACPSCSTPRLLREHLVPGLLTHSYLSKLPFGTKLESASPGRCLTITTANTFTANGTPSDLKILVDGVEISRPEIFNDGRIIIHEISGFISPLSPASCSQDPFPYFSHEIPFSRTLPSLLLDAILRLRGGGFSILSLAMRVKYAELAGLQNMTVFALDDRAVFTGGHRYLTEVRFHIVPNRVLMNADLMKLPEGTVLPTLVRGQHLVVTRRSQGPFWNNVRINYVPIKAADVIHNAKIAVHCIFLPFPHLYLEDLAMAAKDGILDGSSSTFVGDSPPVDSFPADFDDSM